MKKENDVDRDGLKQQLRSAASRMEDQSHDASPNTNPFSPNPPQESGSLTASAITRDCRRATKTSSGEEGTSQRAIKMLESNHDEERMDVAKVLQERRELELSLASKQRAGEQELPVNISHGVAEESKG